MPARINATLTELDASFSRNSRGSVVTMFGIAFIPIMMLVGVAVDYSRANDIRAELQAALDAAVLAGAKDGSSTWTKTALNTFDGNVIAKGSSVSTPSFVLNADGSYSGTATAAVPTVLLGIVKIPSINVNVAATAAGNLGDDSCILTLDHNKSPSDVSLVLNGAPKMNLTGCGLRSNTSLNCNGHDGNTPDAVAAGTSAGCSNPQSSAPVVPDIYSPLASNISQKCGGARPGATWVPGSIPKSPDVIVVTQGGNTEYHVCGDLTLSGTGYLTGSAPATDSIIVIENGSLTMADGAAINTVRTAIVLTGNNSYASSINFPNGKGHAATLSLSPPTSSSDLWQGVSLYQDPALTNNVNDDWGPGATFNVDGVVYLPNADLVMHGSGASNNTKCTKIVTNTFTADGAVDLNFAQTGCVKMPLKQWAGVAIHLVK